MRFSLARLVMVLAVLASGAQARSVSSSSFGLSIEPVVGYERSQRLLPTPHTHDHLVYGGRVTLGLPLLALEGEYLHANDTETLTGMNTTDVDDSVKLGARAGFRLGGFLSILARGGVQAKQNKHTEDPGTTTTTLKYYPYAGAGLRLSLSGKVTLSAEMVAVFTQWPDMNKNEYQPTVGFSVRLP
jgi:hypothetical protein